MEIDREKQEQARARARQSLLQAEVKREEARLQKSADLFLEGKLNLLGNDEFTEHLAAHINRLYRGEQRQTALRLIDTLEKSLVGESVQLRERSLMVLLMLTSYVFSDDDGDLSAALCRVAAAWLRSETEFIIGFEPVCLQLQKIVLHLLTTGHWREVEQLVVLFNRIATKKIEKNNLIHGVVARLHAKCADQEALDHVVAHYLAESGSNRDSAETILINMGSNGTGYLIDKLAFSNDKDERLALIDLIPRLGAVAVPPLLDTLDEERPWFVVRNIVMIISRLNDDALYRHVEPYRDHPDVRVQQQVINCIEVLGGARMKERLVEALPLVNDELKAHLIDLLVQFTGRDIESALLDLLEERHGFSNHIYNFLVTKLCQKAAAYPSERTITSLMVIRDERCGRYGRDDSICRAASDSIGSIETYLERQLEIADSLPGDAQPASPSDSSDPVPAETATDEADREATGDGLDADLDDAGSASRQPPQDPDPSLQTYLSQDHHLMVFSGFYEQLTTEEANEFFAALTPRTLEPGDQIVSRGAGDRLLYFIDNGFAAISSDDGTDLVFLPLQAGEMIGSEGFFDELPWSVSLQSQTELQVRTIDRSTFAELAAAYPDLSAKVRDFCRGHDVLPELVRANTEPGRATIAAAVTVRCDARLTGQNGEDDVEIEGTLSHPLPGGFCCTIPAAERDVVKTILGRQITAHLKASEDTPGQRFGVIAGAGFRSGGKEPLTIFVRLYHPLDPARVDVAGVEII